MDVAVFTNLSRDHLDNHGTMENYFQAKKMLFERLASGAAAIINTQDPVAVEIVEGIKAEIVRVGYDAEDDFRISGVNYNSRSTKIEFDFAGNTYILDSALVGEFNVLNIMEAVAAMVSLGFELSEIIESVKGFSGVGGRLGKNRVCGW